MRKLVSRTGVFVFSVVTVFAQGTTSRVLGTVQDCQRSRRARSHRQTRQRGDSRHFQTTKSSAAGVYGFEAVQPGTYEIDVEATGFRKFVSHDNVVAIGQPATVNVRLEVGAAAEQVMVEASAETVQTSTSGNLGNSSPSKRWRICPSSAPAAAIRSTSS